MTPLPPPIQALLDETLVKFPDRNEPEDRRWWAANEIHPALTALTHDIIAALVAPADEWKCFHCGEVFTDRASAAEHFGDELSAEVVCKLGTTDGLLVKMLREAQTELRSWRLELDAASREFYILGAKHSTALREQEEKGYTRGLADGRALSATPAVEPSDAVADRKSLRDWLEVCVACQAHAEGFVIGSKAKKVRIDWWFAALVYGNLEVRAALVRLLSATQ